MTVDEAVQFVMDGRNIKHRDYTVDEALVRLVNGEYVDPEGFYEEEAVK